MPAETPPPSPPSRASTEAPKAWASGRTLNEAQRERKRQMDRVSKSKRRKDDQQILQNLRAKVDELTAKVVALEAQNAQQADASATATAATTSLPTRSVPPNIYPHTGVPAYPAAHVASYLNTGFIEEVQDEVEQIEQTSLVPVPLLPHETGLVTQAGAGSVVPDQSASIQDLFNHLLGMALVIDRSTICMNEALSSDALIRGILYGWDGVLSAPYCCPIWEVLSRFDNLIFGFTSVLTRFSTLKTIRTFMLFLSGMVSTQQLPTWHRPRPTQARFPHDLAIDVLPWPLLRERAVLDPEITKNNKFWREIIGLFQLHWPYAPEQAFEVNPVTGLLSFSGLYEKHVRDLRMWRMQNDFFKSFPNVFDDIMLITPIYVQPAGPVHRRAIKAAPPVRVVEEEDEEEVQKPTYGGPIFQHPTWTIPTDQTNIHPPSG